MDQMPRIVSFLPSATEMVYALGLGDQLVGVTHECDYPPDTMNKRVVVRSAIPVETMTQAEIDAAVSAHIKSGESIYLVDEDAIRSVRPDLILTQGLCDVCAPSGNEIARAMRVLPHKPEILWLTPNNLEEIFGNIRDVGRATGRLAQAEALISSARARLDRIEKKTRNISHRPRVFCMEWIDPIYCSGHWVPEMVQIAGGIDKVGRLGSDSVRVTWDEVQAWAPEILVVMPCGYHLEVAIVQAQKLAQLPGWDRIPAVRQGRVYVADASSYFARPGPRVVEGTELLAHLLHPDLFEWLGPADAFRNLDHHFVADVIVC